LLECERQTGCAPFVAKREETEYNSERKDEEKINAR